MKITKEVEGSIPLTHNTSIIWQVIKRDDKPIVININGGISDIPIFRWKQLVRIIEYALVELGGE